MQGNTFEKSPSAPVGVYEQSGIEASGKFGGRARKEDLESVVPFAGVLNFIEDEEIFYMTKVKKSIHKYFCHSISLSASGALACRKKILHLGTR